MDSEAYYKDIQYLFLLVFLRGPKALRRTFLSNWKCKEGADWTDTAECGRRYWEREKTTRIKRGKEPTRGLLRAGDSAKWDFTALKWILADSSVHPLEGEDREDVLYLSTIRNDIAHFKPESEVESQALTSKVDVCSGKLVRLCRKFASELESDFLELYNSHQSKIQERNIKINQTDFLSSAWTEIKNLHNNLKSKGACGGDNQFADIDAYSMTDPFFECKDNAESPSINYKVKAAEIADLAKRLDSLSALDTDEDSTDATSAGSFSAGEDSDSEKTVRACVYVSGSSSNCTKCMQIFDAVIMRTVSKDIVKLFRLTRAFIKTESDLEKTVNRLIQDKLLDVLQIAGLEAPTDQDESGALRVLKIMVERGIQSEDILKFWNAMTSQINSFSQFSELVELAACDGWFSVERVIDSFSFVVFLKMSKFAAEVLVYVTNTYPEVRELLRKQGIALLTFEADTKFPNIVFHDRKREISKLRPMYKAAFDAPLACKTSDSSNQYHVIEGPEADTIDYDSGTELGSLLSEAQTRTAQSCVSDMDVLSDPFDLNETRFPCYADALKTCWHVSGSDTIHATEIRDIFLKYGIKIGGEHRVVRKFRCFVHNFA